MRPDHEAWRQRWSEIYSTITEKNDNWVGPVSALAQEIERDCRDAPDGYLSGLPERMAAHGLGTCLQN
jgi:hypothetical protein